MIRGLEVVFLVLTLSLLLVQSGQAQVANIHVSPSGFGSHSGSSANPMSFAEAVTHLNTNPCLAVTYTLAPGQYGNRQVILSQSNSTWKLFKGSQGVEFDNLEVLPANANQVLSGFIAFEGLSRVKEARIEVDYTFLMDVSFSDGPLVGHYTQPSSYYQGTALVLRGDYLACVNCEFYNYLMGVVLKGTNYILNSHFSHISEDAIRLSSAVRAGTSPHFLISGNRMNIVGANKFAGGHPDFIQGYSGVNDQPRVDVLNNHMTNRLADHTPAAIWTEGILLSGFNARIVNLSGNVIDTTHSVPQLATGKTFQVMDVANSIIATQNTLVGGSAQIVPSGVSAISN